MPSLLPDYFTSPELAKELGRTIRILERPRALGLRLRGSASNLWTRIGSCSKSATRLFPQVAA
jgi:hypothetical protein